MDREFKPEITLDRHKQAALAQTCATAGYKIIHEIARSEVDKFVVDLINVDSNDAQGILEKHRISKVAAQLYQGITNRINHEVQQYIASIDSPQKPVDLTAGLLDLGPFMDPNAPSPLEEGNDYE